MNDFIVSHYPEKKNEITNCHLQYTPPIQFTTQEEEKQVLRSLKSLSKKFITLMMAVQTVLDIKSNQLLHFSIWGEQQISWAKLYLSDELHVNVDTIFREIIPTMTLLIVN